jgi:hypothetical protein
LKGSRVSSAVNFGGWKFESAVCRRLASGLRLASWPCVTSAARAAATAPISCQNTKKHCCRLVLLSPPHFDHVFDRRWMGATASTSAHPRATSRCLVFLYAELAALIVAMLTRDDRPRHFSTHTHSLARPQTYPRSHPKRSYE